MHLSPSATVIAISLLLVCADSSAEDRSATSSSQRYTMHVPSEVKFGRVQPAAAKRRAEKSALRDVESLVFMAETTSGLTIQFETESSEPAQKQPLKLTVGDGQVGSWWANEVYGVAGSTRESVAEANSVQASTLGAGWTTLKIDVPRSPAVSDAAVTTIVVTIVAH